MISSFFLGIVSGEVEIYAKEKLSESFFHTKCWHQVYPWNYALPSGCFCGISSWRDFYSVDVFWASISLSLCRFVPCTICCFFSVTYYPLPWFWKFMYRIPLTWMSCFGYNTITFSHGSMICSSACPMTFNVREAWNVISSRNQLGFATCLYSHILL